MMKQFVIMITLLSLGMGWTNATAEAQSRERGKLINPQKAHAPDQARNWLVCIGISVYDQHDLMLRWADKDADDVCDWLQDTLNIPNSQYELLRNLDATQKNIEQTLSWISDKAKADDRVYMFYAGHGKKNAPMVPHDSHNRVSLEFIKTVLRDMKARNVILIADACYSGKLTGNTRAGDLGFDGLDRRVVLDIAESKPGTLVMTSANGIQRARELDSQKHGLFTHYLLQTLEQKKRSYSQIDLNHDGRISLYELYQQVSADVSSRSEQQPQISDPELAKQVYLFAYMQPTPRPRSCWDDRRPGRECTEATTGMKFVWVPGGCFQMGQTETEKQELLKEEGEEKYKRLFADELPRHEVCLDGFWMGKYEVTNAQYRRWKRDHDSKDYNGHSLNGDNQPVVYVNWNDARKFAEWLTEHSPLEGGRGVFRLPSEAEWEYAARAGTTTSRFWGDDPDDACRYANVADQTAKKEWSNWTIHNCTDGYAVTAPAGSFRPNAFGLYDMLGNVWEWCADSWHENYDNAPQDGRVWNIKGEEKRKLLRGGSWNDNPSSVRGGYRNYYAPDYTNYDVGVRVVRVP